MSQSPAASQTQVTVQWRWLFLTATCVPLVLLIGHRTAFIVYSAVVSGLLMATLAILPRRVQAAERRFTRESLRLLSTQNFDALRALVAQQRLLSMFGRRHLLPEALGLAASAAGQHDEACKHYTQALALARPDERLRIEVNLAASELATGRLAEAEGHYRSVLRRRGDLPVAQAGLAQVLVGRGSDWAEAVDLLRAALPMADTRERPALYRALIRALEGKRAPEAELRAAREAAEAAQPPVQPTLPSPAG